MPALLSSELRGEDADPVRVRLLGEDLIAFRDSSGRVGILPENCPHRGASLYLGRSEGNGIRCVYHGWKFDVTGACVDMPKEPRGSDFKRKIRANAYSCVEAGGVVWTYMGPREAAPPLPDFEQFDTPADKQSSWALQRECNWLQAIEGDLDTSHFGFLHTGHARPEDAPPETFLRYAIADRAPKYKLRDTPFGVTFGAYRPTESIEELYWRIGHFLFPFFTMVPTGVLGIPGPVRAWVPMDDSHTLFFQFGHRSELAPAGQQLGITERENETVRLLPRTSGSYGRLRLRQNLENDYFMDRDKKRRGESFTGIEASRLRIKRSPRAWGRSTTGHGSTWVVLTWWSSGPAVDLPPPRVRCGRAERLRRVCTPLGPMPSARAELCCPSSPTGSRRRSTFGKPGSSTSGSTEVGRPVRERATKGV